MVGDYYAFNRALIRLARVILLEAGCTPYEDKGSGVEIQGFELCLALNVTPENPRFPILITAPGLLTPQEVAKADAGPEARERVLQDKAWAEGITRVEQLTACVDALTAAGWTVDELNGLVQVTAPPAAVFTALSTLY
ncbi:hypothetical protein [Streptomyces sp. NRRL S-350]|uniref:hypothetical protein n=1 Tax=Streptomyces sp. NRRL S-350 TaxID=1463902 RepID=UPI0004C27B76|nr:hypothetical protein [Streptomyces sp. NRRL S-350]